VDTGLSTVEIEGQVFEARYTGYYGYDYRDIGQGLPPIGASYTDCQR